MIEYEQAHKEFWFTKGDGWFTRTITVQNFTDYGINYNQSPIKVEFSAADVMRLYRENKELKERVAKLEALSAVEEEPEAWVSKHDY